VCGRTACTVRRAGAGNGTRIASPRQPPTQPTSLSLIVVAPEHLRSQLRGLPLAKQLDRIERLTSPVGASVEHRVTISTLRSIAARIRFLITQTADLDAELSALLPQHAAGPALLAEPGVGPIVAAQLLVSWSHRGRVGWGNGSTDASRCLWTWTRSTGYGFHCRCPCGGRPDRCVACGDRVAMVDLAG
jgi:hypothetical protein